MVRDFKFSLQSDAGSWQAADLAMKSKKNPAAVALTVGRAAKSRGEEFELAFDGFEGEAAGVGKRPAEWALKPFGAVVFHATGDLRDADDAAGFKGVRQVGEVVFAFDVGEGFGRRVGLALAGMD